MLDVCLCVIVEEEKEREARGNLCAEVRGIMVWRNRWPCRSRDLFVLYCTYRLGKAVLYGIDIGANDVYGLYTEDRCPRVVLAPSLLPFPCLIPSLAPLRAVCRLLDHANLSPPAQIFSARGCVPVHHYFSVPPTSKNDTFCP
jgi:hypothetical protein